jgi:hypothetical protein
MQTITIDIINVKVLKLLQDLEMLQLIRLRNKKVKTTSKADWPTKYKGSMTQQPVSEIDNQLNDLRNGWE